MEIIFLGIILLLVVLNLFLLLKKSAESPSTNTEEEFVKFTQQLSLLDKQIKDDFQRNREEIQLSFKRQREELTQTLSQFQERLDNNSKRLNDLLKEYSAPLEIDYLSIDTEGSEYEILKNFDFEKYSFKVITVEHNNTVNKTLINELLEKNGYKRQLKKLSQFESWYTKSNIIIKPS